MKTSTGETTPKSNYQVKYEAAMHQAEITSAIDNVLNLFQSISRETTDKYFTAETKLECINDRAEAGINAVNKLKELMKQA